MTSVSPEQVVARIPAATRVALLVGTADSIAPLSLSQAYYQQLRRYGVAATLRKLPRQCHEIF